GVELGDGTTGKRQRVGESSLPAFVGGETPGLGNRLGGGQPAHLQQLREVEAQVLEDGVGDPETEPVGRGWQEHTGRLRQRAGASTQLSRGDDRYPEPFR